MRHADARVVIVGAGFGGLMVAKRLAGGRCHIDVIDRRNHHLFQPLLYQVATAGLAPSQIAMPIRAILRHVRNCQVLMEEVVGVDPQRKVVRVASGHEFAYDYLVIATGASTHYFGQPQWQGLAPGLKTIEDATHIRRKILQAFEQAENEPDPARQGAWLNFVVVGGGPTGVEVAGAIVELSRRTLVEDFRRIDPRRAQVYLVESGSRVLAGFSESLSRRALEKLESMGVRVHVLTRVIGISADAVQTSSMTLQTRNVIWAAGVTATPVAQWLGVEPDRSGRVRVNAQLEVPGFENVFVIGDAAAVSSGSPSKSETLLPGIAPVALQEGRYVARKILDRIRGRSNTAAFSYFDQGMLATIGRSYAVAEIAGLKLAGRLAWLVWSWVHVFYLIGFRNRILVMLEWIWAYATFQRGSRLIVGKEDP